MHWIEKVEVTGFWGTHDFSAKLNEDVTFFIGPNGTGKTTLINLIAASLYCDFTNLVRLPFKSITLILQRKGGNQRSTITVHKNPVKDLPFETINYEIKAAGESVIKFSLEDVEERLHVRYRDVPRRYLEDAYRQYYPGLPKKLRELVSVCWLSIHRAPASTRTEDRTFESSVDQRIADLSNELVKYISSLSRQKEEQVARLQEFIFLSLLSERGVKNLWRDLSKEDANKQKSAMAEIFRELHVAEERFAEQLRGFFSTAEKIAKRKREDIDVNDIENLASQWRITTIIEEWDEYKKKIDSVYANKNRFEEIVNGMFIRKEMSVTSTNEINFRTRTDKILTPSMLSSGEKQMLILLGEALLQRGRPYVYIADEPELSLHVTWQEKLIDSILALNSSAQVICATHSPDVVGRRMSKVIEMEKLVP